jgi:hypothetical protein
MQRRELLDVLKSQAAFLQGGGYRQSPRTPWKAPLIFEDSPTCLNFGLPARPHPCTKCILMRFVPLRRRSARVPCRYIPLNAAGETLDGLYRYASPQELEQAVAEWLQGAIRKLQDVLAREQKLKGDKPPLGVLPHDAGGAKLRQE